MTSVDDDKLVENLIDFSEKSEESESKEDIYENIEFRKPKLLSQVSAELSPEQSSPKPSDIGTRHYSRLCGYLNKLGNNKILKTFRRRWFVFSENNCKLYYYRSPQDQEPLGEIDISQATFTFDVTNKERTGSFKISVPGRDYFLEANNRQTCLFWLQELQKHRRANSAFRTKNITEQSTSVNNLAGRPQSGLLAKELPDFNTDEKIVPLMLPVDCPKDEIGDDSALNRRSSFLNSHQKFNLFYNQVKSASFVKYDKSPSESSLNSPSTENLCVEEFSSIKDSASQKSKPPSLASFKSKLSHSFRKVRLSEEVNMENTEKERCSKCPKLENKIENLSDEVSNLRDEVVTSREVLSLLQRQLDIASKEKETLVQIYELKDSEKLLKVMSEKDQKVVNLSHDVQEQKQEVEVLQRTVQSLKNEVAELRKNNELFQEMLIQKDKTIMALTNEIFDLETEKVDEKQRRKSVESVKSESTKPVVEPKEAMTIDDLKDAVQAFELQNKFLNNEILELNHLRRDAEDRVQLLSMKCSEWEARSYQIQSKLLFLLNELKRTGVKDFNLGIVDQLLQEAAVDTTTQADLVPSWSREKMYDELGFNWRWGKEDLLSTKAINLKQKSEDIANKSNDPELTIWRSKWDNFIVSLGAKELQRSPELKILVRMGIPCEYRGKIWKGCTLMWIKCYKSMFGSNYYTSLLTSKEYVSRIDPSVKQIELDLLRTLPNNRHYENLDSNGIIKLRRVLLAYSRHDPAVGYCQGLNRLVAIALLFMDEEDAFWCLIAITKYIMPEGYYTRTLIGSQVDQRVLKDLMADKIPRLHAHFEQHNVDLSLFTFNWFLTIFVDNIPVEIYLRIWDVFLYEGSKVLFRYALAIFKSCENEILEMKDYLAINKYLRNISEQIIDAKKLTSIAFGELNPFPQRTITSKRAHHYQIIKAQLEEFESMRNSLPRSQEKVSNSEYLSEDD
ncbi:TBC1 domain family member 2B-like [Uloborus diversus]|uniref:TBC1 domain family member 2B-like n=1 Tax=Uloborus diversus TaxID=327109 RepID=UPI002409907B|nr:TBC1 domain family member 2B-like [Uloborus diversus]